ncbi:MAG: nitroreductase family protein [bacterium]
MDAIDLLLNRNSHPALTNPAPNQAQLETLFAAAFRAPDHALLRPTRLIVIEGEGLHRLGDLFAESVLAEDSATESSLVEKARGKPLRAPMIITVVSRVVEHPKVPDWEQLLSSGAAAHSILLAAEALGFGAIWLTGPFSQHALVRAGLGLAQDERIISFIYVGTRVGEGKQRASLDYNDRVSHWP